MSAEIAAEGWQRVSEWCLPKSPPRGGSGRSRQKPRLLPAGFGVMSAEIAEGDFGQ